MTDTVIPARITPIECGRCHGLYVVGYDDKGREVWVDPAPQRASGNLCLWVVGDVVKVTEVRGPQVTGMRRNGQPVYRRHGGASRGNSCQSVRRTTR